MRIFISWSGEYSKHYSSALRAWLPCVIQNLDAFMSSHDIQKGDRWLGSIFDSLDSIDFGVVVLTPDNFESPWVQFESGALSKNLSKAKLVPILCDVSDSDLSRNPLSSFQYVKNDKSGILDLVRAINRTADSGIPEPVLDKTFDLWWPEFEMQIKDLKPASKRKKDASAPDEGAERLDKIENSLDEVLFTLRRLRSDPAYYRPARPPEYASLLNEYELLKERISKVEVPSEREELLSRISLIENRLKKSGYSIDRRG